jgi:tRNA(Ile)-lysidine synthase
LTVLEDVARGVVVGVSGGPDSVALLRAVQAAQPGPVVAAHFNHQLRGDESDGDERFVADLVAGLSATGVSSLSFVCGRLDVAAAARTAKANLESTARRARYAWLVDVARAAGAGWVAVGHTADDQAETVLHRLLRGAGIQGLRGIAERRELAAGVRLVRPLLRTTRAEIVAYLEALGQRYRCDSSNADLQRTRNRIRRELLPHLTTRYNPAVAAVLARLATQADELFRDQAAAAAALVAAAERPRAGDRLIFDLVCLKSATRRLVRAALRMVWAREGWPVDAMTFERWQRLTDLVFGDATAMDLAGRLRARRKGNVLQIGPIAAFRAD